MRVLKKAISSSFVMFSLMTWHRFWLTLTNATGKEIIWICISMLFTVLYLCFFFNHIIYKHWVPFCFEECMALKSRFPDLWENFSNSSFVVYQTPRKGSGITMAQALKKQYHKPAEGPSGVIRFFAWSQAVWKWNIFKNKKFLFREALTKICKWKQEINVLFIMIFQNGPHIVEELR